MFLYILSLQSMRALNTQQVYSAMSSLAARIGGDCSAELSGVKCGSYSLGGLPLQDLSSAHCSYRSSNSGSPGWGICGAQC